jgi:AcrR family transcriptional regulator
MNQTTTVPPDDKSKEQIILEAAEQEFLEQGFETAKTTRIAARAGVTHALLHYYYRTKENLFRRVLDRKLALLEKSLDVLFKAPELSFAERLCIGIETHFDFIAANAKLPRFVLNEVINKPHHLSLLHEHLAKTAARLLAGLQAEIDREVAHGTIRPISAVTLLVDIASLNVFTFAALPLLRTFAVAPCGSEAAFLEARKKENVEIIRRRLFINDNE